MRQIFCALALVMLFATAIGCATIQPYGARSEGTLKVNFHGQAQSVQVFKADFNGDGQNDALGWVINPAEDHGKVGIWWMKPGAKEEALQADVVFPMKADQLVIADVDEDGLADVIFFDLDAKRVALLRGSNIPLAGVIPLNAFQTIFQPNSSEETWANKHQVELRGSHPYLESADGQINIVLRMWWHDPLNPELDTEFEVVLLGPRFVKRVLRPELPPKPRHPDAIF